MFTRSLAILLAVLGLYLSAVQASAQPRGRGWGFGGARYGFPRAAAPGFGGGYGRGYGRGFGSPYGRRFGMPPPGYGRGYPGGYPASPPAYTPPPRAPYVRSPRPPYGSAPYGGGAFGGDWRDQQNAVRQSVREGRTIPLGRAIQAVRQRVPGRELDAGLEAGPNGRPVYRVRWAGQDGRRQDYMVDAGTGAVLGVQGGP